MEERLMDTASKILIVTGMANLMVGALSGIPMGLMRQGGAEVVPTYLTMVHLGALMLPRSSWQRTPSTGAKRSPMSSPNTPSASSWGRHSAQWRSLGSP